MTPEQGMDPRGMAPDLDNREESIDVMKKVTQEEGNPTTGVTARRRCTATSKGTGKQCQQPPIKGGTVCWKHGGAAPQVRRAAKDRLREMIDPALNQLIKIIMARGTSDADRLRAVFGVLDRTGYPSGLKMDIEAKIPGWQQVLRRLAGNDDELLEAGAVSREQLEQADTAELRRMIRELQADNERLRSGREIPGVVTRVEDDDEDNRPVRTPRVEAAPSQPSTSDGPTRPRKTAKAAPHPLSAAEVRKQAALNRKESGVDVDRGSDFAPRPPTHRLPRFANPRE